MKPEKVLFVVDWIVLGRMPWKKLWSYDIQGMINSTRDALNLDFDVFKCLDLPAPRATQETQSRKGKLL